MSLKAKWRTQIDVPPNIESPAVIAVNVTYTYSDFGMFDGNPDVVAFMMKLVRHGTSTCVRLA